MQNDSLVFIPTQDFFSEAFDSHYCQGLQYTAHPENSRLRDAVAQWSREGKVTTLVPATSGTSPAQMGGTGTIA
jgi:hypothetical protein